MLCIQKSGVYERPSAHMVTDEAINAGFTQYRNEECVRPRQRRGNIMVYCSII